MLEAQVVIHPYADAKEGDILVVALEGHPWGVCDTKHLLVVKWQDDVLEALLRAAARPWPVIAYPYKTKDRFSAKQIDLSAHPDRAAILDRDQHVPILPFGSYRLATPSLITRVKAWVRRWFK